jgi:hypothetical protein
MKLNNLKAWMPAIIAVVLFLLISVVYFSPLLENKVLRQTDIMNFEGASKEIADHREKFGEEPLWTNSMFGGMPAYQISVQYQGNKMSFVDRVISLGLHPYMAYLFLSLIGFYLLLLTLKVDKWLAIAGAIAFAFSSYFFIIVEAGHNTKAHAIAYMAPVLAGILLTYRGKYLWGGVLTALALALQITTNHPQITYYLAILVLLIGLAELIEAIVKKAYKNFLFASAILIVSAGLAVATNTASLWATWEYGQFSIRGKTELSTEQENRTSGLDKDYATAWSYGKAETFTLLVPNFKGGSSQEKLGTESAHYKFLRSQNISAAKQIAEQAPLYWGAQPFTSGPVYAGAIVVFLFVLGMFLVKGWIKWALIVATALSIMLAWGKNFMGLTDFFLDFVPGYNKFRAVSMILVIAQLTIPLLAFLGVARLLDKDLEKKKKLKAIYISSGIVGGLLLVFLLGAGTFSYTGASDEQQESGLIEQVKQSGASEMVASEFAANFMESLRADRKTALVKDTQRSLLFVLIAAALLYLFASGRIRREWLLAILPLLILIDMWGVARRYLNEDNYVREREYKNTFARSDADELILKDQDLYFRVFNIANNPFNDAMTSYWHKSIGGYHGAKLRRYQELIDAHISKMNFNVLNMLNTKYIINRGQDGQPVVMPNVEHMGNAWFVNEYKLVENADSELAALQDFDPSQTAFIDKIFGGELKGFTFNPDSLAGIKLTDYRANQLTYRYNAGTPQLAVFSDIYYPKGWNAYVDGELKPHFRANFVLRAMVLPEGDHELVFKFEPEVFRTGERVSLISSLIILLLLLSAIGLTVYGVLKPKS